MTHEEEEEMQHDISKLWDQVQQILLSQRVTKNEMEAKMYRLKNILKSYMEGLKDGMKANTDGIEAKTKGNMEDLKNGIKEDMEFWRKVWQSCYKKCFLMEKMYWMKLMVIT